MKRVVLRPAGCLVFAAVLLTPNSGIDFPAMGQTADALHILTPKPPDTPRINGPSIFGVRPGSPLLYRIPATGVRPMEFSDENLPAGLQVDRQTGQITGSFKEAGEYLVTL